MVLVDIGRSTVADFEASARRPNPGRLASLRTALEPGGVDFIEDDDTGAKRAPAEVAPPKAT